MITCRVWRLHGRRRGFRVCGAVGWLVAESSKSVSHGRERCPVPDPRLRKRRRLAAAVTAKPRLRRRPIHEPCQHPSAQRRPHDAAATIGPMNARPRPARSHPSSLPRPDPTTPSSASAWRPSSPASWPGGHRHPHADPAAHAARRAVGPRPARPRPDRQRQDRGLRPAARRSSRRRSERRGPVDRRACARRRPASWRTRSPR